MPTTLITKDDASDLKSHIDRVVACALELRQAQINNDNAKRYLEDWLSKNTDHPGGNR